MHDCAVPCVSLVRACTAQKWIAIVRASIAAHLKYFIKRSLAVIFLFGFPMRKAAALSNIFYRQRDARTQRRTRSSVQSQIFFISLSIKMSVLHATLQSDYAFYFNGIGYSAENLSTSTAKMPDETCCTASQQRHTCMQFLCHRFCIVFSNAQNRKSTAKWIDAKNLACVIFINFSVRYRNAVIRIRIPLNKCLARAFSFKQATSECWKSHISCLRLSDRRFLFNGRRQSTTNIRPYVRTKRKSHRRTDEDADADAKEELRTERVRFRIRKAVSNGLQEQQQTSNWYRFDLMDRKQNIICVGN